MSSLRGKLALITGGSRGIGLAIAKTFAARGASTVLVARDPARLRAAVQAVQAAYISPGPDDPPEEALPFYTGIAGDVSQAALWEDLYSKLKEGRLGHQAQSRDSANVVKPQMDQVDVLVNCAGIAQKSLLMRTEPDKIAEILDTNLRSAILGCKYISRLMLSGGKTRSKSIINVSSVMALMGGDGAAVYAASKAGLLGLTSAMALELRSSGIRVNALLPGYITTDMTESLDIQRLRSMIPCARLGNVDEVADAAAFLAQNGYANNCILTIDGGLSAGVVPVTRLQG